MKKDLEKRKIEKKEELKVLDPRVWGRPKILPDDTEVDEDAGYWKREDEKTRQYLLNISKMIELTQINPKLIKTSENRILVSRVAVRKRVKFLRSPLDYNEPWSKNPLIDQVSSCGACGSEDIDIIFFATFDPLFKVHYYIVETECSDYDKFSLWEQYRRWDV